MATAIPAARNGPRDVERARILVRLDADQRDQAEIAVAPEPGEQRRHVDARVGLVDRLDIDGDVRPEHRRSAQSAAMP